MLLQIKTTDLWQQWRGKHDPVVVKSLPATAENKYFDENPVDQDTYEDYQADRRERIEKCGQERWQVPDASLAAREARWIMVFTSRGRRVERRRTELLEAGYILE